MVDFGNIQWLSRSFRRAIEDYGFDKDFIFVLGGISLLIVFLLPNSFEMNKKLRLYPRWRMLLTIIFIVIGFFCVGRNSPFLYFNF